MSDLFRIEPVPGVRGQSSILENETGYTRWTGPTAGAARELRRMTLRTEILRLQAEIVELRSVSVVADNAAAEAEATVKTESRRAKDEKKKASAALAEIVKLKRKIETLTKRLK